MANSTQPNRDDPIRRNYFRPLEVAESISGWLFDLGAAISFAPLVINQINHPKLYSGALVAFSTIVVMIFIAGNAAGLYFFPRAEDAVAGVPFRTPSDSISFIIEQRILQ